MVVHPKASENHLEVPLYKEKNADEKIEMKILVGVGHNSPFFYVIQESQFFVSKFAFLAPLHTASLSANLQPPNSFVKFALPEAVNFDQVESWIESTLGLPSNSASFERTSQTVEIRMVDVRSHSPLYIYVSKKDFASANVEVRTPCFEMASEIVQSVFVANSNVDNLESTCSIPKMSDKLNEIIEIVNQSNVLKTHFAANISENIQNVKVFIVRAESCLLVDDIEGLRKNYAQVQQENGALVGEYQKRTVNHEQLLKSLKQLNALIKQASNMRSGKKSKDLIAAARNLIKTNQLKKMEQLFQKGVI